MTDTPHRFAIVTGASTGIGLELAKCAARDAPKMYDTFKKKENGCIKVVMKPNG
ncbi:MAG TPA: hypothetical protein VGG10_18020 [Rhizomicrobium sp.]